MTAPYNVTPPPAAPPNGWMPYQYDNKQGKKPFYKRWWFWLIVVLVVLGAAGAGGANESSSSTSTSASTKSNTSQTATPSKPATPTTSATQAEPAKPAERTIELQATATGNGTVIIYARGSTSNQEFSGSWSKTYTGDEAKDLTMFSVHSDFTGGNDQQVTCKVIVNGQEKDSKSAFGSAGSAMCDVPWF